MIGAVECRTCSQACLLLGTASGISKKRAMVYMPMARAWIRLAKLMDRLAAIKKEEEVVGEGAAR
jgi:hypothetical protein